MFNSKKNDVIDKQVKKAINFRMVNDIVEIEEEEDTKSNIKINEKPIIEETVISKDYGITFKSDEAKEQK